MSRCSRSTEDVARLEERDSENPGIIFITTFVWWGEEDEDGEEDGNPNRCLDTQLAWCL